MNITLFLYLESICFVFFFVSMIHKKDIDIQIIFMTVSFLTFIGLALQSFDIELTTLETTWQTHSFTEYYYVLFNLLMAVISLLVGFTLVMERSKQAIGGSRT